MGYSILPDIHWRKQSNSPDKFMGSGMYPAGAYVTYEHEYILIFRKGSKRLFKDSEKDIRKKVLIFGKSVTYGFQISGRLKEHHRIYPGGKLQGTGMRHIHWDKKAKCYYNEPHGFMVKFSNIRLLYVVWIW